MNQIIELNIVIKLEKLEYFNKMNVKNYSYE